MFPATVRFTVTCRFFDCKSRVRGPFTLMKFTLKRMEPEFDSGTHVKRDLSPVLTSPWNSIGFVLQFRPPFYNPHFLDDWYSKDTLGKTIKEIIEQHLCKVGLCELNWTFESSVAELSRNFILSHVIDIINFNDNLVRIFYWHLRYVTRRKDGTCVYLRERMCRVLWGEL